MAGRYKPESGPRTGGKSSPVDYTGTEEEMTAVEPAKDYGKFLTPALIEEVKRQVSQGVPVPTAVTAVGAGNRAKHWSEIARQKRIHKIPGGFGPGESPEVLFMEAVEQAKAQCESYHSMNMHRLAEHDWKASLALLERRASRRWHLQSKLSVELTKGKQLEITSMSHDKLIQIARGLLPQENIRETLSLPADVADGEIIED